MMKQDHRSWIMGLILLGPHLGTVGNHPALAKSGPEVVGLTDQDRKILLHYARDTWRSIDALARPSGLPADSLCREATGVHSLAAQTTPTNIAAYLWSVIAAERLGLISAEDASARLEKTLTTLARMERVNGFFLSDLDSHSGVALKTYPDRTPISPLLSTVDNAWLAASLMMVENVKPALRGRAQAILEPMDFRFFFDPYRADDPEGHPGLLRVGYHVNERAFFAHYGMLNSEARIASYVGITRGQLPPEHYYHLYRTLPKHLGPQSQEPRGQYRTYRGVKVFEGSYGYRDRRIVPSWGGSMFEALMVTLFIPEERWAPRSWGVNHPLYVRAQIEHGMVETNYRFWGFSPACRPAGGYLEYGVKALGTDPTGYLSHEPAAPPVTPGGTSSPGFTQGVVTPHAAFLALPYAPQDAFVNLRGLSKAFPIYGKNGFQDSVNVATGKVSNCILALDQGMIMASIANALADEALRHAFSDGRVEKVVRPLIEPEEFSAGTSSVATAVSGHRDR